MTRYSILVALHVASVIVWVGGGTTVLLLTVYPRRAPNGLLPGQLGALVHWLTVWVLLPASLAAPAFGVAAAHAGHWSELFFFHVGEGAFTFSFLLTLGVRLPLLHQARRGKVEAARLSRYLAALAVAELTVLYVAVADMVAKPTDAGSSAVRDGAVVIALGLVAALAIAVRARRLQHEPSHHGALPGVSAVEEVRHLHQLEHAGESSWTPVIAIGGLFVFLLSVELLTFGIVEGAFHFLASAALGPA